MEDDGNRKFIGGGEGFGIYTVEENGKFLLIFDESTTIALLSDSDTEGLSVEKILEFTSEHERQKYLSRIKYRPVRPLENNDN